MTRPLDPDSRTPASTGSTVPTLADLGWDAGWAAAAGEPARPGGTAGRVGRCDRGRVVVHTAAGPVLAAVLDQQVTTGDWVLLRGGRVRAVLPRRTALVRGAGGRAARAQVLAANVDVVLVVVDLSAAPNPARLDRLLAVAWSSGAEPVVVLTKADLCTTAATERAEVAEAAAGAPVVLTSAADRRGIPELRTHLAPGRTLALLGASGAGKSSLVNALAGAELRSAAALRADGTGRHTTVTRDLVVLPGVGVLVDTPGLRGVQLWAAGDGLARTFADVTELAGQCRFDDCRHAGEPGCAVAAAVADGTLPPRRPAGHAALQREVSWLQARYDARQRAEQRRQWKSVLRSARRRGRR